jgi:hypothetical protein
MERRTASRILLAVACLAMVTPARAAVTSTPAWCGESDRAYAEFGYSVSTAGDVNGDGYSDVIVGARRYDGVWDDQGQASVFLGGPGGVASTPVWTAVGDTAEAWFGWSVATAGDVNGDGYDDVLVGVFNYGSSQSQANEGRVCLYLGSSAGPAVAPSWTWESNQPGAHAGSSVATAGDVNGDGYDDVIVGAMGWTNGAGANAGAAFLFLGGPTGLAASPVWTVSPTVAGSFFGYSVATAGDVNGDGLADVIVGAPWLSSPEGHEGGAFVFLGTSAGGGLQPGASWSTQSNQNDAQLGCSVSTAGDVNGDGYSDVIVGAPYYDYNGGADRGLAEIFAGTPTGPTNTPMWAKQGTLVGEDFGFSVFAAGDVNGDGRSDVIVGSPGCSSPESGEGRASVFLGITTGVASTACWSTESNQADAGHGSCVATAGDVNGDGFSDVLVGARWYDGGQTDAGRACVYHGGGDGLMTSATWQTEGDLTSAWMGYAVASAGDVNGDGLGDLAVSAYKWTNPQLNEGRVLVFCGTGTGLPASPSWAVESNVAGAFLGYSINAAGDVNGDGYTDFIAGAPGISGRGAAYVFHGSAGGLSPTANWTGSGSASDTEYGHAVASAGDVNGDGYGDVIIGDDNFGVTPLANEGAAFVYLGSASGLAPSPVWTEESNQAEAGFGISVAAGDVNGDGFSDVIVGAPGYDNGQTNEGKVFVYCGSVEGLSTTPSWTAESNQAGARFGCSVAAGDVNADGFSDVIIGASLFDNGQTDEGRAFVYLGSPTGLAATPVWTAESDQASAAFGIAVANAGDVNGDGYSDVAVGASLYTDPELQEGKAWIYHGSPSGPGTVAAWSSEGNQIQAFYGRSLAGAGDINGDGFADVCVGATAFDHGQLDEGRAYLYYGGGTTDALATLARQVRVTGGGPVDLLGMSDKYYSFRLGCHARTAYGRNLVRVDWNAAPFPSSLASAPLQQGSWLTTGAPVSGQGSWRVGHEVPAGLATGAPYHWRMRIAAHSPYFPHSPWRTAARSVPSEQQLRLPLDPAAEVTPPRASSGQLAFHEPHPNPLRGETVLTYRLAMPCRVTVTVHDVSGRCWATLVDAEEPAGLHAVTWDGRRDGGGPMPRGVYFARVRAGGDVRAQKLVLQN